MPKLERPTCTIHYLDEGSADPAILFLHGWCCDGATFSDAMATLRGSHRCLAPDMRGHGQSTVPLDHAFSVEALCGDVLALCDSIGVTKPVLVGHSFGGYLAAEVARRHPGFARGLLLLDQCMDIAALAGSLRSAEATIRSPSTHMAFRESLWSTLNGDPPHPAVTSALGAWRRTPVDVALALWAVIFDWSVAELSARGNALITAIGRQPAIIVDRAEIPGYHEALRSALSPASIRIVAGGHWIHLEHPAAVELAIRELAAQH